MKENIDNLEGKKLNLSGVVERMENEISSQNENLAGIKKSIVDGKKEVALKDEQIEKLDKSIAQKEAEYKIHEDKLFSIQKREDAINEKEEFIKSQYQRAGVKWED